MKNGMTFYGLAEIRAVSYFSTSLYTKESVEEVLWDITKNVVHQLGFVDCVIYRFDPKDECLHQQAAYGQKNPLDTVIYNQIAIKLGTGIVGSVAQSMEAEIVNDTSKDPRYIIDDEKRYSELCVPIVIGGKLFGVIDTEHPLKGFFLERHLHLLTIIASLCSQKIKELCGQSKKPLTRNNVYFKKLEVLMKSQKIYRNPSLSLSSTAELLGISACYLSSTINAIIEGSFIDYINSYRVAEVKRNLQRFEFTHYTVVSVGLEAGFNSKSAFYKAFKKHTGITPTRFRNTSLITTEVL